jgi:hypothetical protein
MDLPYHGHVQNHVKKQTVEATCKLPTASIALEKTTCPILGLHATKIGEHTPQKTVPEKPAVSMRQVRRKL